VRRRKLHPRAGEGVGVFTGTAVDTAIPQPLPRNVEDAVFEAALSLDEEEREALLQAVFRENPEGLARVRRMLDRHGEAAAFFLDLSEHSKLLAEDVLRSDPAAVEVRDACEELSERPGAMIGPYRILSKLGGGGSGVVYEAEQQFPARRIVALKVLRPGMDTESVIARFRVECQALALMDHPNIARVYDAGATPEGRPYFVMERVRGERITAVCDRERLDIASRIRLFIQVCHGIQHAHQKGVIHRDIKPSNILVSHEDGMLVPKVIDFGIAKATDPSWTEDRTLWTTRDQIVGTPPYMSPEQVDMSGIDVDMRTDVYSLGALLYELLGGKPPFDGDALMKAGISAMRHTLLEKDPPVISRMLASLPAEELERIAAARQEDPDRLASRLRVDLDWIVARAMEKDRNRRYQTVNALAADLSRHLSHQPVLARRPGRFYVLAKFVRRNRLACGFGAAVAISLLAGLGVSTTLYFREREALAEQERLGSEAEAARSRESQLRRSVQTRANVSLAAVLLADGKIEEADALLLESPPESIEPSREAAGVFRALGGRNAIYGRWPQALRCFLLLAQANRLDDPVRILEQNDVLTIAPALLKGGAREAYETFRLEAMDRHLPVTNSVQAERLLKICLLTPADGEILQRLAPAAQVCWRGIQKEGLGRSVEWEAFSLALYHFRRGDLPRALEWIEKTLSHPDPAGSRKAATLCLRAIAMAEIGDRRGAIVDYEEAQAIVQAGTQFGPDWEERTRGTWYSWVMADLLLEEAKRTIFHEAVESVQRAVDH
jgi:Serine/threonine protein kinase